MIELVAGIQIREIDINNNRFYTTLAYSRGLWTRLEPIPREHVEWAMVDLCRPLYRQYAPILVRWNAARKPSLLGQAVGVTFNGHPNRRLCAVTIAYIIKPLSASEYNVEALDLEDGQREVSAYTVFVLEEERNQYMLDAIAPDGQRDIWDRKMRNLI